MNLARHGDGGLEIGEEKRCQTSSRCMEKSPSRWQLTHFPLIVGEWYEMAVIDGGGFAGDEGTWRRGDKETGRRGDGETVTGLIRTLIFLLSSTPNHRDSAASHFSTSRIAFSMIAWEPGPTHVQSWRFVSRSFHARSTGMYPGPHSP